MRKKQHKMINPNNKEFDKYYIINYLEYSKVWQDIKCEQDDMEIERYSFIIKQRKIKEGLIPFNSHAKEIVQQPLKIGMILFKYSIVYFVMVLSRWRTI